MVVMVNNQDNQINNINKENEKSTIEIIEFSNDTSESKGILTDDTATTEHQNDFSDKTIDAVDKLINTTDYSKYFGSDEVKQYKMYATLCYIPLVVLYFKYFAKIEKMIFVNCILKIKRLVFHCNKIITRRFNSFVKVLFSFHSHSFISFS